MGAYGAAASDCGRAISLNPRDALAYLNRGRARYGLHDWLGARADWTQALRLFIAQGDQADAGRTRHNLALLHA